MPRAVALFLIAALGAVACIGSSHLLDALGLASTQLGDAHRSADRSATAAATSDAVSQAAASFATAHEQAGADPGALHRATFLELVAAGDFARARALPPLPDDVPVDIDIVLAQLALLQHEQQHTEAADYTWRMAGELPGHQPVLMERWYALVATDTVVFPPAIATLVAGEELDSIEHLDRGTSLIFRLKAGRVTTHVLKPDQTVQLSNYRGEIATARLCPLIRCEVLIPTSDEVRVSQQDFLRLTGLTSVDQIATTFIRESTRLVFTDLGDPSPWLYGVRKAWVDSFATVPLEETVRWEAFTRAGANRASAQRARAIDAWSDLLELDPERYRRMAGHFGDLSGDAFARQLSSLHVLDVLANNWDRYRFDRPGANLHIANGQLVSIDNGATFQRSAEERGFREVQSRVRNIQVFSRGTVEALRRMNVEAIAPLLFPDSPRARDDDQRIAYMDERRRWLLEYIDGLIERHGEDAVLVWP